MADPHFLQVELPAGRDDLVEHLRQQQAVDDVAGKLDLFGEAGIGRGGGSVHGTLLQQCTGR